VDEQPVGISVDIGCVRMTERHFRDDPPTGEQIAAATLDIEAAVDKALSVVGEPAGATLVGVAGTVTTVTGVALDLPGYDPARIHHSRVSAQTVRRVADELLGMTHDQRLALPVMHPGRADVIGAGALILRLVVDRCGVPELVASEHDILDGIAYSLMTG
jgi:exopolyphosphatase/guanosine-5'-triphosphate,3'-diphosphate pyrophosphatase